MTYLLKFISLSLLFGVIFTIIMGISTSILLFIIYLLSSYSVIFDILTVYFGVGCVLGMAKVFVYLRTVNE